MIQVDRKQFIDGVEGNLLTRNAKGEITSLGDAATRAIEAAEKGETVELTVNRVVWSRVENKKEIKL